MSTDSPTYQVIARRWRPQSFDQLVGQDAIVRTLKNAIELDRIAHAYLFVGPRGTGKTSTARLFAKSLNCTGGPSITPPQDCSICEAIMKGSCMDVIEIDGASNNSVDQIRDLREDCQYAPAQSPFKIYIIDEVHMLSTAAFNALLKTLEEPPAHVKFIFATTEAHKVLPTIVSRCQRLEFRPIATDVITQKLSQIAQADGFNVEPAALDAIARMARGGMRDGQSILEQLVAFCGNEIKEQDVVDVYGLVPESQLITLKDAILDGNYDQLLQSAQELESQGRDLSQALGDLQRVLRKDLLKAIKEKKNVRQLMDIVDVLRKGQDDMKSTLSEAVKFELTLLEAAEVAKARPIDELLKEVAQVAKDSPQGIDLPEKKKLAKPEIQPEPKPAPVTPSRPGAPNPLDEAVKELNPATRDLLEEKFRADYKAVIN